MNNASNVSQETEAPLKLKRQGILTPAIFLFLFIIVLLIFFSVEPFRLIRLVFRNPYLTFALLLPAVLAIALTTNKRTPDLTYFSLVLLSHGIIQASSSPAVGIILALLVCIVIGAVNGVLVSKAKVNPIFILIGMAIVLLLVSGYLLQISVNGTLMPYFSVFDIVWYSIAAGAFALSLILSLKKGFWIKDSNRDNACTITVFLISSLFAALSGVAISILFRYAIKTLVSFHSDSFFLIMILSASLFTSNVLKERVVSAVFFSLIIALFYEVLSRIIAIMAIRNVFIEIIIISLTVLFLIIGLIINKKNRNTTQIE